jgi:hypothetical protein
MIRIIFDPEGLTTNKSNLVVTQLNDFVLVYHELLALLGFENESIVTIHNSVAMQWFKNMSLRYPQGTFIFLALDAHQAQAQ